MKFFARCACLLIVAQASVVTAQQAKPGGSNTQTDTSRGDKMLAEYFAVETKKLQEACLSEIKTLDDWNAKKGEYRRQLLEMLGLDPLPERTDLKAQVTGKVERDDFVVEQVHFQSRPELYVTGNLYLPKKIEADQRLPAILYVCGHGASKKGDVSFGNKVSYQHHGAWFARNGYVCLIIDTLQMGEIEGIHHGTHRYGMWWWLNRGYTPAGVEAWNCVRALDYLETRPEVDKTRFGVTGRSGGGAYSWWIAAIDERIQCAVPVAGITDLTNHVVDGCVEGHCDCMYILNTYRWDYPQVAALVAPRPLLISNTDSDGIFPLDGVVRTFDEVRRIYRLYDATEKGTSAKAALNISPGPHKDTQELQIHAFRWFNHYLKGDDSPVEMAAVKFFEPEELKVFDQLPADEINTKIHESFVPLAAPAKVPENTEEWAVARKGWRKSLIEKSFRTFYVDEDEPREPLEFPIRIRPNPFAEPSLSFSPRKPLETIADGIKLTVRQVKADREARFALYTFQRAELVKPDLLVLTVVDSATLKELKSLQKGFGLRVDGSNEITAEDAKAWKGIQMMLKANPWAMAYVIPRGVSDADPNSKQEVQMRRRFYLLGQTLESMQVHDVRRALLALRLIDEYNNVPLWLQSRGSMAGVTLYASLFEPGIQRLDLYDLPKTHRDGPIFLNVNRYLDMPQAVAMAAERSKVVLYQDDDQGWEYPQAVAARLGWDTNQIQIRKKPKE